MIKKQKKIPKTYRLPENTIESIEKIKESFLKDNLELSSDGAVISYSVGVALALCKDVDNGYTQIPLTKEEIKIILQWYETSTNEKNEQSNKLKEKLIWNIE